MHFPIVLYVNFIAAFAVIKLVYDQIRLATKKE